MVTIQVDQVTFPLKEFHDFSWLQKLGTVFAVFSQNDSGNISFGVENGQEKFFVKAAGLKTAYSTVTGAEAVAALRQAVPLYENLRHPNLIELVDHFPVNELYAAVFKWASGECLFDYWNFDEYAANPALKPPSQKFRQLSCKKRLQSIDTLFSFLITVAERGYAAVDFYDGSILYDFATDSTTICDIDFFRKQPLINDIGTDYWGTKRLKAPEEYCLGAAIDEKTNLFTLGALIFHFFGSYSDQDIHKMYESNSFHACPPEQWGLGRESYLTALKAVAPDRDRRYGSITEFYSAWRQSL